MSDKKQYSMLVYSNPTVGMEQEYNDWYAGQHVFDLLRIPGFVGCRFFKIAKTQLSYQMERSYDYLMIWDIETDDIEGVCQDIKDRMGDGRTVFSASFDKNYFDYMATPITKYVTSEEIKGKTVQEVLETAELEF